MHRICVGPVNFAVRSLHRVVSPFISKNSRDKIELISTRPTSHVSLKGAFAWPEPAARSCVAVNDSGPEELSSGSLATQSDQQGSPVAQVTICKEQFDFSCETSSDVLTCNTRPLADLSKASKGDIVSGVDFEVSETPDDILVCNTSPSAELSKAASALRQPKAQAAGKLQAKSTFDIVWPCLGSRAYDAEELNFEAKSRISPRHFLVNGCIGG
jgi:hypothetical protein